MASPARSSTAIPTGPTIWRLRERRSTNATCSCSRWRSRRRRTTKAASAGPCSAAANRARPRPFGRASIPRPRREVPREWSEGFIRRLLAAAYDEKPEALADLRKAGFRVYTNPGRRAAALVERRAAAQMDRALPLGKGLAPRRPLSVDLLPLEVPARGGAQGLSGRRAELAAVPGQPRLLRRAALPGTPAPTAAGRADSPAALALPPRGPQFDPHSAVGLAARGTPRQRSRTARLWAGPRHVPPLAPLAADPSPRRPVGRRRHRGQADPRALEHRPGRHQPVQQTDGPQRPDLEPRVRTAAGRSAGDARRSSARGRPPGRRRAVRLSHDLSGHARGRARGLLASPAGRVSLAGQWRSGLAARRPAGLSHGVPVRQTAARSGRGVMAAAARSAVAPRGRAALLARPREPPAADAVQHPQAAGHPRPARPAAEPQPRAAIAHAAQARDAGRLVPIAAGPCQQRRGGRGAGRAVARVH